MKNYYEMVCLAFNCNYRSNFYCDLLCPLSVGNIFILFTNHIFYSAFAGFSANSTFIHKSSEVLCKTLIRIFLLSVLLHLVL